MQLKSIGRISEAGNLLDNLLGDFSDIDKVSAAIENLTLTESAELLVKKGLGDKEAKLALTRKVGSDAAAIQALESAKVTAAETAETGATVGLSTAFKGLAASMKAFATSVPGILAIITAVGYGAYKLFDLLTVSYEEHLEKLEEAKQAYTDAESEVESLQGQLDELNSKIEEINNQDTLSLSDEQDLKNLVAETKELQRQLNIAKERAKFEGRKAEREAIDTLNSKQVSNYKKGMSETGEETVSLTTSREELKEAINAYDRIKDAVDDYQAQIDILESSGIFEGDQYDKINKNLEYHKQLLDETGLNITNLADELRGQSDSLIGATEEGNKLKLSVEESLQAYDEWHNRINNVSEAFDTLSESEQKQVLINKLADKGYDYEKIAKIVGNLSSDAFKTISDNFSDFEKQIDEVSEKSSDINVLSNSISRFVAETSKLKDGNVTRLSLSESLGDIKSFKTEIESTTTAISALTTAVSEQYTQNYITQESYDALIDANSQFAECIEFGNGYMRLNVQQANELTKANAELKLSELDLKEALEVEQYNKNIEALKQLGDSDDELRAKLEAENSKIEENVRQYDLLEAQLLGVTSAYNDWIASQSAPDVGDQYDKMVSDYKKVEELYQKGLTGDAEFQAFNKLIGGEDAVTADFEKNLETFKRYFSETEVGINNFIDDIVRVNNLELNADGLYDGVVDWQKTMQELGLTHDEMQSLFDKLEQYEFHIDTTSGIDGLDDLKEHQSELNAEIENYRENIEKAKAQGIDTTDAENSLKSLQERYASITDEIVKMKDEASDGTITLDVDAELAKLDLSNISQEAQETLNKLKADNDQLKLSVQMGVDDTSYLEGKVQADLALLKEQLKVPVEADSEQADKSIGELTKTATDFDKIINQAKTDTQNLGNTRVGDLGFNSLGSSIGRVNTSVTTLQSNLNTISSKTYTLKINTSETGKGKLLGTTGGFAFANGSGIAAQESSLSLTGELGRELVVRGDRWFTVGDNGAEFAHIKKGDIVFSADQTSQLLDGSGKINSRGTALASGTAYNRKESSKTATSVKGLSHVKTTSTTTGNNTGKTSGKNNGKDEKKDKSNKSEIDWIARKLERLQSIIDLTRAKFENLFNIDAKKSNLDKQIEKTTKLQTTNEKAVDKYQKKAANYAKKTKYTSGKNKGKKILTDGLIKKIQNGQIKGSAEQLIKEYGEQTYNAIIKYQDYWDKARNAEKAAEEAITKQRELQEEKYQLYIDEAEANLDNINALSEINRNYARGKEYLEEQIKWINQKYDYEIEIAKLNKDEVKEKQLVSEKEKEITEAKKTQLQLYVDDSEAEISKLDALIDISTSYKQSNKYLDEQKKHIQDKYKYEIEIAKLEKDITKEHTLQKQLQKELLKIEKSKFDNIQQYYDTQLDFVQEMYSLTDKQIELIETKGAVVNSGYYKDQQKIENEKLQTYNEELKSLKDQAAVLEQTEGGKYSEEWIACQKAILSVNSAIADTTINLSELNNKINENTKAMIDRVLGIGDRAIKENNFIGDLTSDIEDFNTVTHQMTTEGLTRLQTYSKNMNIAASEASYLGDIVKKLESAYDKGKMTVDLGDAGVFNFESFNQMREYIDEFYDSWQDKIKETNEYQSKIIDFMRNKLKEELAALNEIIDAKSESLNAEKELRNYQKSIREQTTNIGLLQKQMTGVSGDTSEEGIARYLNLQKQLSDAEQQLEETEFDHVISEMQASLDKLSEEYSATIDALSSNTGYLLEEGNQILTNNGVLISEFTDRLCGDNGYIVEFKQFVNEFKTATDALTSGDVSILNALIGNENSIISAINADKDAVTKLPNYTTSLSEIKSILEGIKEHVNPINSGNNDNNSPTTTTPDNSQSPSMSAGAEGNNAVATLQQAAIDNNIDANKVIQNAKSASVFELLDNMTGQSTSLLNGAKQEDEWDKKKKEVEAVFANSKYYAAGKKKKASDYETKINQYLFSKNKKVLSSDGLAQLRKILGTTNDNLYNVLMDLSKMKGNILNVGGFAKGGIGKLVKPTGEDGLTWVRNGEGFVRPEDVKHIQELLNVVPDVKDIIKPVNMPNIQPVNNNSSIGDIKFNIEMNGVNDVETFSKQIREAYCSDEKIRKMIQSDNIMQLKSNSKSYNRNMYR